MLYQLDQSIRKVKTKTLLTRSTAITGMTGLVAGLAMPLAAHAATTNTVVIPANFNTIFTRTDDRATSSYSFVAGPNTPPKGAGSLELTTNDGNGKQQHLETQQSGTKLSKVNAMSYSTYRHADSTATAGQLPAINMEVSTTGDTTGATGYTTLIYEPIYQSGGAGAVQSDTWQNWDAYNSGNAIWWSSHDLADPANAGQFIACNPNGANASTPACAGKLFVPFSSIVAAFPQAKIISYGVNQGTGNAGLHANVDALSLSTGNNATTYDFEQTNVPTNKSQCKNGGYADYTDANGNAFASQGACISYVNGNGGGNSHKHTKTITTITVNSINVQNAHSGDAVSKKNTKNTTTTSGNAKNKNTSTVTISF